MYHDIATCVKGLATFGTPHHGSQLADFFYAPLNVLGLLGIFSAPNLDLLRAEAAFVEIMGIAFSEYRGEIHISSFYETLLEKGICLVSDPRRSMSTFTIR